MSDNNSLYHNFKSLWVIMSNDEKKKSFIFIFLTFIQVALETISIGSFYPLLIGIFDNNGLGISKFLDKEYFRFLSLENISSSNDLFLIISIIIGIIFIIKNAFLIFLVHWAQSFERDIKIRLKSNLLNIYLKKDYLFHVNSDSALLVRNVNKSTSTVMLSIRSSMMFVNDTTMFVVLLLFMLLINPTFVIYSSIAILFLTILYFFVFKKLLIKYGQFSFAHEGDSLKRLFQSFLMIKEIKLFNKESFFINFFVTEEREFQEFQRKAFIIRSYPRVFFELLFILGMLFFVYFKVFFSSLSITQTLPEVAILTFIIIRMLPSINKIISSAQKLNQYQKSNDQIINELDTQEKTLLNVSSKFNNENKNKFNNIELKNIKFRYSKKNKYILDNINFKISKGNYIGIVGTSGSGKSTLIDVITGLLKPESGEVTYNNQLINTSDQNWKNLFGYVPQNLNLFNDTLFTNITFENDINKVDIKNLNESINKSGLEEVVRNLDNGIYTQIGEYGGKFSGGEKQRISIARALYRNPEILIFDESFNSLDLNTKQKILYQIKNLSKIKTVIIISHIQDDLKDCDLIFNLITKNFD